MMMIERDRRKMEQKEMKLVLAINEDDVQLSSSQKEHTYTTSNSVAQIRPQ